MRRATFQTSKLCNLLIFLSTLSLRRATILFVKILVKSHDFYPRSPCGERLSRASRLRRLSEFLSTLSLRRATAGKRTQQPNNQISIHALLAESDPELDTLANKTPFISIHALLAESDPGRAPLSRVIGISIHALLAESDNYSAL